MSQEQEVDEHREARERLEEGRRSARSQASSQHMITATSTAG